MVYLLLDNGGVALVDIDDSPGFSDQDQEINVQPGIGLEDCPDQHIPVFRAGQAVLNANPLLREQQHLAPYVNVDFVHKGLAKKQDIVYLSGHSAGLAYALGLYETLSSTYDTKHYQPYEQLIAATGKIDSQGNVSAIEHINEKFEGFCDFLESDSQIKAKHQFSCVYARANEKDIKPSTKQRVESLNGELIGIDTLPDALNVLLDNYCKPGPNANNPYKGLDAFSFSDRLFFYGRDKEIDKLVDALHSQWQQCKINVHADKPPQMVIKVHGNSGTGKSSLLQAGLLPALQNDHLRQDRFEHIGEFHWAVMRPTQVSGNPLAALIANIKSSTPLLDELDNIEDYARQLIDNTDQTVAELMQILQRRSSQDEQAVLLLVIDQLEELFTAPDINHTTRIEFLRVIAALIESTQQHVWLCVTLRSDYESECEQYEILARLFDAGTGVTIGLPTRENYREIIEKPAKRLGLSFEHYGNQTLAEILMLDADKYNNGLALLEYTLSELYSRRCGDTLSCSVYKDELKGIKGALQMHADALYQQIVANKQTELFSQLLHHLVLLHPQDEHTLSIASPEIDEIQKNHPQLMPVLESMVSARLLVQEEAPAHSQLSSAVVRMAHDVLIAEWDIVRQWARQVREAEEKRKADIAKREIALAQERQFRAEKQRQRDRRRLKQISVLTVLSLVMLAGLVLTHKNMLEQRRTISLSLAREFFSKSHEAYIAGDAQLAAAYVGSAIALRDDQHSFKQWAMALLDNAVVRPQAIYQHAKSVRAIEFSPDGKIIATASADHTVQLWDAFSGTAIGKPLQHEGMVRTVRFSENGQRLLSASDDHSARVWNASTGLALSTPLQHKGKVNSAQFNHDGSQVVTASWDTTARVWDSQTGKALSAPLQHDDIVWMASFSPDGRWVLTASDDGTARLWDAHSGELQQPIMQHAGSVVSARFSHDGKRIITASEDSTAQIWSTSTLQMLLKMNHHEGPVWSARFSPDDTQVVTTSADNTVAILNAASGELLVPPLQHQQNVWTADFSPDGRQLLTVCADNQVRLWDTRTGQLKSQEIPHDSSVWAARFSPDGRWLATATERGNAFLWPSAQLRPLPITLQHNNTVWSAQFSPNDDRIVTASFDGSACLWDVATGKQLGPAMKSDDYLMSALFDHKGERVVTASSDQTARIWNADTGLALTPPLEHTDPVRTAHFSADGHWVVTASDDGTAKVWQAETGEAVITLTGLKEAVISAVFDPQATVVLTASSNSGQLWDRTTGKQRWLLPHEDTVWDANFSPDGSRIVTASWDGTARLWETASGQPINEALKHQAPVNEATFSPDGQRLVTITDDGSFQVWDGINGKPLTPSIEQSVVSVAFSPDSSWLLTGAIDGKAKIWDIGTGKPVSLALQHQRDINSVAFSHDGRWLVTASEDTTAKLWPVNYPVRNEQDIGKSQLPTLLSAIAEQLTSMLSPRSSDLVAESELWRNTIANFSGIGISNSNQVLRRLPMANYELQAWIEKYQDALEDVVHWQWLVANPYVRNINPWHSQPIQAYVDALVEQNTSDSLNQALDVMPGHPLALARLAYFNLERPATARLYSRLALQRDGQHPQVMAAVKRVTDSLDMRRD